MPTRTFQKVQLTTKRTFTCTVCGNRGQKSQTFWQTVNPWNRNEDGQPKTWAEVDAAVQAEADAWAPEPIHDKCRTD